MVGKIIEIKALATGNVLPLDNITYGLLGIPRGIAINNSTKTIAVATSVSAAASPALPDQIQFYFTTSSTSSVPYLAITGGATGLNVPSGIAYDSHGNLYVANRQGASVESFAVPSPTPTPTPTAAPSPTATPTTSPSPTPTPTPYALDNLPPHSVISGGNTGLVNPTSVALDANNVIYVVDAGNPSVRIFAAGATGNVAPVRTIAGAATLLTLPTDVKVDTNGLIYVADPGAGKVSGFCRECLRQRCTDADVAGDYQHSGCRIIAISQTEISIPALLECLVALVDSQTANDRLAAVIRGARLAAQAGNAHNVEISAALFSPGGDVDTGSATDPRDALHAVLISLGEDEQLGNISVTSDAPILPDSLETLYAFARAASRVLVAQRSIVALRQVPHDSRIVARLARAEALERVVRILRDTQSLEEVLLVFVIAVSHELPIDCALRIRWKKKRSYAARRVHAC